ncbi:MFS transporter [Oricola sp.]|uniref:MFS transporter n=1 Tax=Oricola sp. TaxID=1979950 RepID=UPI0025E371E2|nr:MFS transporter [Oricola sp.]MCI5077582.1 MFS transporter [Oricola sp.]
MSAAATLLMIGVGMIVPLLPQRIHAETGSLHSVGLVASVFAVAYLLAQLPAGMLADRLGAKPMLVAGYGLCAVSGVGFFMADRATGILAGRAVQGLGEAPIWALGPALLSIAYPAARGRAIGIYNAAIHLGLMTGPMLGLLLVDTGRSQTPFLVFATVCLLGAVAIASLLPRIPATADGTHAAKPSMRAVLGLFLHGPSRILLTGIGLYGACYGVFISVLPITMATMKGAGSREIAYLFVVFYAGVGLSQLVAGPLSDRYGRTGFMTGGLILAIIGLSALLSLPASFAYPALALASLGLGVFCVASLARLNDVTPHHLKGTVSGTYYFAWAIGYVLGPMMIGLVEPMAAGLGYGLLTIALAAQALMLATRRAGGR